MKKTPSWEYLAGLLDGEGCISITKIKGKTQGNGQKSPRYRLRVSITQKNKGFLEFLKTIFGGFVTRKANLSNCHHLMWWDNRAAWILGCTMQHLILKEEQARVGLEFVEYKYNSVKRGRKGLSEEDLKERERFKQLLHALKP